VLLSACGREGGNPDSPGSASVRNSAEGSWSDADRWRLVRDAVLPEPASEPLVFPTALEADAAGNVFVLDAQTQRVHVYDPAGRHVRSFGRAGAGPGELKQPIGIALAPDGGLWVADAGNQRYTVFGADGTVRETRPRQGHHVRPWPGRFDAEGTLWDVEQGPGGPSASPVLVRLPRSGAPARLALPAFTPAEWRLDRGAVQTSAFIPYTPTLVWALTPEGRVWSGVSGRYRLALHEPGGDTIRTTELPLPAVPVTGAERDTAAAMLDWFTSQGGRVDPAQIPRHKPAFTAIHVDDQGYLWIRPSLPAGEPNAAFDVLQPDGRYLGRVSLPAPVHELMPVRVRGDRLYTVQLDENDVPSVVRYHIERRAPATRDVAQR
jgi:sugar lactone lactonase YvrE